MRNLLPSLSRRQALSRLGAGLLAGAVGACAPVGAPPPEPPSAPPEGLAAMVIDGRRVLVDLNGWTEAAGRLCAVVWPRTGEIALAVPESIHIRPTRTGHVHAPELDVRYPENGRNWRSVTVLGPVVGEG